MKECPFWLDDSKCVLKGCHVESCPEVLSEYNVWLAIHVLQEDVPVFLKASEAVRKARDQQQQMLFPLICICRHIQSLSDKIVYHLRVHVRIPLFRINNKKNWEPLIPPLGLNSSFCDLTALLGCLYFASINTVHSSRRHLISGKNLMILRQTSVSSMVGALSITTMQPCFQRR